MSISLEQLSAQMRRGEQVPLRHTMQVVLTLSIPSMECWPVYICPLPFRWHSIWVQTGRTMHAVYCANL